MAKKKEGRIWPNIMRFCTLQNEGFLGVKFIILHFVHKGRIAATGRCIVWEKPNVNIQYLKVVRDNWL